MKTENEHGSNPTRPNIIIILADDLGFSDVGCFGSEIETPNIDSLSAHDGGMRFTQMYNCARCCPSRASLLTGVYPHQAGIGHMVYDAGVGPAYQGFLKRDVETVAEMLKREYPDITKEDDGVDDGDHGGKSEKGGGYATCCVGKWHVGSEYPPGASREWIQNTMGDETHPTPTQRGFDKYYGTLGGGGSYYQPPSLVRDDEVVKEVMPKGFYYTDAINDEACDFIDSMSESDQKPFFMYVAHCAPHWPLHAPKDEIDKYRGKYMHGWDKVREDRHSKLIQQGLIPSTWKCSPRDEHSPPWENAPNKEWEDARMATYAAQVTIMDHGVGRILNALRRNGVYDNTVIFFMSDNGGCAEYLKENGEEGHWPEFYGGLTREGQQIQVGNLPNLNPGGDETFMSYDLPWSNASNTPFRLFKSFVHEGGISTPFVVHWPSAMSSTKHSARINNERSDDYGKICHSPWVMMDIVATCCDLAGVPVPDHVEGESFLPILHGNDDTTRIKPIFWEHQGNRAVRDGQWKLVYKRWDSENTCDEQNNKDDVIHGWELYNMEEDRTELHNLATQHQERVQRMEQLWFEWATRVGVKSWPLKPLPEGEKDWSNLPWMW
mmetsp:Transcript_33577/g.61788  ORF Transcript_33577/g.61788 Transcript_33577/m.61788 type:complete len:606 (-) Transcript_33577:485-2302(-)